MKKRSKQALSLLLSLMMVLTLFGALPLNVAAEEIGISSLAAAPAGTESRSAENAVNWYYSTVDKGYYLFVPQVYDKSALRVWFDATGEVTCGGAVLENGAVTDVFAQGSATLHCGSKDYRVTVLDGGDVGTVQITTESGSLEAVHADKSYKDPGFITVTDYDGTVQYSGDLDYIKGRGNSTWNSAKKPYNIKLAKKADLFGMGKAKKWCLLANAGDATMMRDLLGYRFAKTVGLDVTSDVIPVNLYVNGNYMGAYAITEKVEIGENRVDIYNLEKETEQVNEADLDTYPLAGEQGSMNAGTRQYVNIPNSPENITGGYLLELEKIYRYPPENSGFITNRSQAIVIKEPENSSKEEVDWIADYYQEFEDALYSPSGYNAAGKYYTEYLDSESVARIYLAEEFGANFDGCSSSFFLYKDTDGKIAAGPAWDFDLSFRQTSGINYLINNVCPLDDPNSLYIQHCYINYDNLANKSFLAQLFSHNDFQEVVQRVWNETVKAIYPGFFAGIAQTAGRLHSTVVMNSIRWNTYGTTDAQTILNRYESRVGVLTDFIPKRYAFLSEAYSEDTFFVKYDAGAEADALVWDTAIYHSGDTAEVQDLPRSSMERCAEGWYLTPDYSGEKVEPYSKLTVNGNTKLYTKWTQHSWQDSTAHPGWQQCAHCGKIQSGGALVEGWQGDVFYANGKPARGVWLTDANGKKYQYEGSYLARNVWQQIDGKWYFFDGEGYAYTGVRYVRATNTATPMWYDFGAEGGLAEKTPVPDGFYMYNGDTFYVVNGATQFGAQQINGDIYFFKYLDGYNRAGYAVKDTVVQIDSDNGNGVLTSGKYYFDAQGKLATGTFLRDNTVFADGKMLPAYYGLVMVDGSYYYVDANSKIVTGVDKYLKTTNGLTFPSGTAIPHATYHFDETGKMVVPNGLIDDRIYVDGVVLPSYYGLVMVDGNYYYVDGGSKIFKNGTKYLKTTNGLTYATGKPIPNANFEFDADGKMIIPGEIIGDYYYINGEKMPPYYGLVKVGNYYYYVDDHAKIVRSRIKYLTTTNNLKLPDGSPVPHANYEFDADGRMQLPSGLKGENYYINGVMVPSYYGLVKEGGYYYYVDDHAKIVRNRSKYLTSTNGLTLPDGSPVPHAYFDFDADGRMQLPSGIQGDFYYINGVKAAPYYGLVKDGDYYYYVDDNSKIVRSRSKYLKTTNGLTMPDGSAVPHAYFDFDADGRMQLPSGISGDYYYINGVKAPSYYGLVKYEGNFYYVDDHSKIVKNRSKYLTTTNGLTFGDGTAVPHKTYRFDADGKMIYA